MKALLYCTKGMPALFYDVISKQYMYGIDTPRDRFSHRLNGQIVAEVEIDEVNRIWYMTYEEDNRYDCLFFTEEELCFKSCLDHYNLHDYLKGNNGYALRLTNLKVFDKPKDLSDYDVKRRTCQAIGGDIVRSITDSCSNAPQNMCNVYDNQDNHYVLISIQPQHLCRILNGRKTIEVRRKVLNCLKEMCENG